MEPTARASLPRTFAVVYASVMDTRYGSLSRLWRRGEDAVEKTEGGAIRERPGGRARPEASAG